MIYLKQRKLKSERTDERGEIGYFPERGIGVKRTTVQLPLSGPPLIYSINLVASNQSLEITEEKNCK